MFDIVYPKHPLYELSATVRGGKINCDHCFKTVPEELPKLMDKHMEIHAADPKTVSAGK